VHLFTITFSSPRMDRSDFRVKGTHRLEGNIHKSAMGGTDRGKGDEADP
jgi:hypothetical protein